MVHKQAERLATLGAHSTDMGSFKEVAQILKKTICLKYESMKLLLFNNPFCTDTGDRVVMHNSHPLAEIRSDESR